MTDAAVNLDDDNLDDDDRRALERCIEIAKRRPSRAEQLEGKLQQGDPWIEVAELACCVVQSRVLNLKPWQLPPCNEDEDDPDPYDRDAQKLLRQMLAAGVSRYEPDPLAALQQAKRKRKPPSVKAALRGKQ
jgi:hypothetical protein